MSEPTEALIEKSPQAAAQDEQWVGGVTIDMKTHNLFSIVKSEGQSLGEAIFGKAETIVGVISNQGINAGEQAHPFDMAKALLMIYANEYHSNCIQTKVAATFGLGFVLDTQETGAGTEAGATVAAAGGTKGKNIRRSQERLQSKVDKVLDALCIFSWADTLNSAGEDFVGCANGYLEVVREIAGNKVIGVNRLAPPSVKVEVSEDRTQFWYKICQIEGGTGDVRFARWGHGQQTYFTEKYPNKENAKTYSEIVHVRRPNSASRWYGVPSWFSAIPTIELSQCMTQYKYDFYYNRGVPEYLMFITGGQVEKGQWTKIEQVLRSTVGVGNTHKSGAFNLPKTGLTIQVEKLSGGEGKNDTTASEKDSYSLSIVTAHRVPPLLAGIQVPGKLGAQNEMPNTMAAFQALVVGQDQLLWSRALGRTLGSPEAGLGLAETDFDFWTIMDEIDLAMLSTVGGMKESVPEAKAEGRDLSAGPKP